MAVINSTSFDGTANNALYLGGTAANGFATLASPTFTGNVALTTLSANGSVGTNGQLLTSNGSVAYWATPAGGGLSILDSYKLTSDQSINSTTPTIISSWTQNTPTMTPLGGGVTNNSGVFSFPSTGYWEVCGVFFATNWSPGTDAIQLEYSTDSGSTYTGAGYIRIFQGPSNGSGTLSHSGSIIVYISNITTNRFRITATCGTMIAVGNAIPSTFLTFKKLA